MSNITGGFTAELSSDAVQTSIDKAMYEKYDRMNQPAYLSVTDGAFFKTSGTNLYTINYAEDSNVGMFERTGEQAQINRTDTRIGNKKSATVVKYMKSIPISYEAFKADQVGKRQAIGEQVGDRAKLTQDYWGILNTFGDAFDGNTSTTPDGDAWASASHTTLTSTTVDNLESGALDPDYLWTSVNTLANMPGQDGDWGSYTFELAVTPFILYKKMKEVMNSTLIADSTENNINIFDTDYGNVAIKATSLLGSSWNDYTNANTAYYIMSRNHMLERKVFSSLSTSLIPPESSDTDSYEHRSRFIEVAYPASWSGFVASTGA